MARILAAIAIVLAAGCARDSSTKPPAAAAPNLLLITVDTMRADRIGVYGDASARTPAMDGLAKRGAVFANAFAVAPITLPSHASLLTGRYPAGHGSRHNGMRVDLAVPTLADKLAHSGFATAAFVAAFPLDRRFGLIKGFQTYGDRMPRETDGRLASERPGREVVDDAIGWLQGNSNRRFFLWVHLFEPHAPYGNPRSGRPALDRYGDEIAEADAQIGRLVAALGAAAPSTVIIATSDHGEAFGEHGEISHSVFVYDTTLRVPLIMAGPGVAAGVRIQSPVTLVDLAGTAMTLLGVPRMDTDGVDLGPTLAGNDLPQRTIYAESYAPLLDFGWSPLRAVREGGWKLIDAPEVELFDTAADAGELRNLAGSDATRAAALRSQVARYAGSAPLAASSRDPETAGRLQALGYVSGGPSAPAGGRVDPKQKRGLAARIARVTSGELRGAELERALKQIIAEDPANPQANLRLGYVMLEAGRCGDATARFRAAIAGKIPSADAHLGLAACQVVRRDFEGAAATLRDGERLEPGNPVVSANLGVVLSDGGKPQEAIDPLQRALTTDPDLHQARFALAIAFARAGRRAEANRTAQGLLARLPQGAPQRPEVERLIAETR